MGRLFRRRQPPASSPQPIPVARGLATPAMVATLEHFGRFSWNPHNVAIPDNAECENCQAAEADREAWLASLADAAQRQGGWVALGAERMLVSVLGGDLRHPVYDKVMEASLTFLRERGASNSMLTGYEMDWWRQHHGCLGVRR